MILNDLQHSGKELGKEVIVEVNFGTINLFHQRIKCCTSCKLYFRDQRGTEE